MLLPMQFSSLHTLYFQYISLYSFCHVFYLYIYYEHKKKLLFSQLSFEAIKNVALREKKRKNILFYLYLIHSQHTLFLCVSSGVLEMNAFICQCERLYFSISPYSLQYLFKYPHAQEEVNCIFSLDEEKTRSL